MSGLLSFRAGGVGLVLLVEPPALPVVLHWGRDLGELDAGELGALAALRRPWVGDSPVTYPGPIPVLPELSRGWAERPGLVGAHADGSGWSSQFAVASLAVEEAARRVCVDAVDGVLGLTLRLEIELTDAGLVSLRGSVTNQGEQDYALGGLELSLPVPAHADELMDFAGRWALERQRQRRSFDVGQWVREARGGKPGLENAWIMLVGEAGFDHRKGEVWGLHVAWPGNQVLATQRTPFDVRLLSGGELLHAGEIVLRPGERYETPALLGSYGAGLDELAGRYHAHVRSVGPTPRAPVTWNSWEAVYFHHDEGQLRRSAEAAAAIGVERIVLDDGWFAGRLDATTSLGDWTPDVDRWPQGLRPFADHVHALGMEFGLWVEPEMVSPGSVLATRHPEWLFDAGHGQGPLSRGQWVLDLTHSGCYRHVADALHRLIDEVGIDALKWDHNRYLLDAGHAPTGRPAVHEQTQAYLGLMAELLDAHPGLEIEACASGGGRADLATMALASRMWPSDCNDPHDRLGILRGTALLLPPEVIGTHIGAAPDHITGRHQSTAFRGFAAIWGQLGVEADLTGAPPEQVAELRWWIDLHKRFRPLLHSGRWRHGHSLDGVVAADRSEALFGYALLERPVTLPPRPIRLPGLDGRRRYRVEPILRGLEGAWLPPWFAAPVECAGTVLERVGLEAPSLLPDSGVLIHVRAV